MHKTAWNENIAKKLQSPVMIEVFKTNVCDHTVSENIVRKLFERFDFSHVNFDLEDCDRILRIESGFIPNHAIIAMLNSHGYDCEALE